MENPTEKTPNKLSKFKIAPHVLKRGLIGLTALALLVGTYYIYEISQRVYSDKAEIYAPLIILSPSQPSVLQKIMVKNGEHVAANQVVAQMDGGDYVRTKIDGVVVDTNDEAGKLFTPGMPVVTMINPDDLRLIVHIAENDGLNQIHTGQKVMFTVDAFDSKEFNGQVEEVSNSSDQSSVVFSISDKRDEKYFSIKVKYSDYPELMNGMSAKAWIYR